MYMVWCAYSLYNVAVLLCSCVSVGIRDQYHWEM